MRVCTVLEIREVWPCLRLQGKLGIPQFAVSMMLFLTACNPRIPNHVSTEEYEIYSAWLNHRLAKNQALMVYVGITTLAIDPLDPRKMCGSFDVMLHEKGHMSEKRLMERTITRN